jgi:hypothetical protein
MLIRSQRHSAALRQASGNIGFLHGWVFLGTQLPPRYTEWMFDLRKVGGRGAIPIRHSGHCDKAFGES